MCPNFDLIYPVIQGFLRKNNMTIEELAEKTNTPLEIFEDIKNENYETCLDYLGRIIVFIFEY